MASVIPGMHQGAELEFSCGAAGSQPEKAEQTPVESAHQDSDCSSASEGHVRQAAAVLEMTEHDTQADGGQMFEMSAEGGVSLNINTLTTSDLSELVSRLYGLVNSLQNENEQVLSRQHPPCAWTFWDYVSASNDRH